MRNGLTRGQTLEAPVIKEGQQGLLYRRSRDPAAAHDGESPVHRV
jgi:hypothetical protein